MLSDCSTHHNTLKRRRCLDDKESQLQQQQQQQQQQHMSNGVVTTSRDSQRIVIPANAFIYMSESYKGTDTAYCEVDRLTLVNVAIYDQITFDLRDFMVVDSTGRWTKNAKGGLVHLWRYDSTTRQLFIANSIAYTSSEEFYAVQANLQGATTVVGAIASARNGI